MDDAGLPNIFDQLEAAYGSRKTKTRAVQQMSDKTKSSAQVATSVRPQVVRPKSCGLKPKRNRPHRLMARFSDTEREIVDNKAREAFLSVNEFIRASVLGDGYVSRLDPVKKALLLKISHDLSKHGGHLGYIENYLRTDNSNPSEGNSMLAMVVRSLIAAHGAVNKALVMGLDYE